MNKYKLILIGMVIISWATVPYLGWRNIKRFTPATIGMSLIIFLESYVVKKWKWWNITKKLFPKMTVETPFICGPFFAGSLWILTLSYGNIYFYLGLNAVIDSLFIYPFNYLFTKIGIFKQGRLKRYQLWLVFMSKSIILYSFQKLYEKMIKNRMHRYSCN
ncbi:hypothetical protein [Falsibacillus pallidus]|uniref:hypothetical protein n=1 Tax=Falsibacillus pallidus TaxID=493781 RepID=UPI003D98DFE1